MFYYLISTVIAFLKTLFCAFFAAVTILLTFVGILWLISKLPHGQAQITINEKWCTQQHGMIIDGHTIDYCNGHPFICNDTNCFYITSVAYDTYTVSSGKTSHTETEQVLYQTERVKN